MCWNCTTSNIRILVVFLCIQDCFYEFHACCEKRTLLWGEKIYKLGLHIKQVRDNRCIANSRVSGWSNLYYSCKPLLAALHCFCSSHSTQNWKQRPASYHCKLGKYMSQLTCIHFWNWMRVGKQVSTNLHWKCKSLEEYL